MSTTYEIDFTDGNVNRVFQIAAYTSNGPETPGGDSLPATSTTAATSLLLTGKGFPNYGEIVAENFVHLTENFYNSQPPSYPIPGQLWFDSTGDWDDPAGSPLIGSAGSPVFRAFSPSKHTILTNHAATPDPSAFSTITIGGNYTARFYNGLRIRQYDSFGVQTEYLVSSGSPNASLDANGNTTFTITPTPSVSLIGQWIGGWDRLMQENSSFLTMDMSAADPTTGTRYKITDLASPTLDYDATNKMYVDNLVGAIPNNLGDLDDTTLTAPNLNDFLVYDSGFWVNKDAATAGVLPLAGGTMTGHITVYTGTAPGAQEAVTRQYVDTAVGSGSIQFLDDLLDVDIAGIPPANSVLTYLAGQWRNSDFSSFASTNSIVLTAGATFTGIVNLAADPLAPLEAATKQYVDTNQSIVTAGSFNALTQELDLAQSGGVPVLNIGGWQDLDVTADNTLFVTEDPETLTNRGLYIEYVSKDAAEYPVVPLDLVLRDMNKSLGNMSKPRDRAVFSSDGFAEVDTTSTYGDLNFDFVPGYSKLQVYQDGLKRIASEHGWLRVAGEMIVASPSPVTKDVLWHGYPSGLDIATTYQFRIQLNSGSPTATAVMTVEIAGGAAQTLGRLVDELRFWSDSNLHDFGDGFLVAPFGVEMFDDVIVFYSSYPGDDSRVDLIDGDGLGASPDTSLFLNLTGSGAYTYEIDSVNINTGERNDGTGTNAPAPQTWHYREIGRVGLASTVFVWEAGSVPAGSPSSVIEIISDHDLLYDQVSTILVP